MINNLDKNLFNENKENKGKLYKISLVTIDDSPLPEDIKEYAVSTMHTAGTLVKCGIIGSSLDNVLDLYTSAAEVIKSKANKLKINTDNLAIGVEYEGKTHALYFKNLKVED